jgi:multicomponent K+:H+ antiporter subunit A
MSHEALLLTLLALPFVGSVVAGMAPNTPRNREAWLAGAVALAAHALAWLAYPEVSGGGVLRSKLDWAPSLGLAFSLRMDGFAWMFTLLVTSIGALVMMYARYYMSRSDPTPRFFGLLLAFMGSMLGVVLAGNLIQLVFFWELTSVFSFLLIGYRHRNPAARAGARMALIITTAGGLCLFAGAVLIGRVVGSYELDDVLASGDTLRSHSLYLPALLLVLAGTLTKSAQFPFHFWLPHAMAAPTPVSAYLHSAAMVKLGVFLMARLWPVLAGSEAWMWTAGIAGLITLVMGAWFALFQHDIKGVLAYSTVSHLGLVTVLLGLDTPLAAVAAVFHMLNHATFKCSLFMAAGIIDHEAGTRDMRSLGGLWRRMPVTATLAIVAAAAMAGVPLMNGFLSKEMFFAEALEVQGPVSAIDRALPYIATLWGVLSVAYSLRLIHGVFFGKEPANLPRVPHEPPRWMRFPVELLAFACVAVGIFPAQTIGPILDVGVRAMLGNATPDYSLAVWHGFTLPLAMSFVAMAGGVVLYVTRRRRLARRDPNAPVVPHLDGRAIFDRLLTVFTWRGARVLERALGTQRLQPQLWWLLIAALLAALWPVWHRGLAPGPLEATPVDPALAIVWTLGAICAVAAAAQAKFHRFAALLLASGAGLVVCLTFVRMSAPDLALTQMLVEIVTAVLLLLGLRWLPKRQLRAQEGPNLRAVGRHARDLAIAAACGLGLAALAYAVMTRPLPDTISGYFMRNAYALGGGTNVVNVIIVDFRGFDTLGEITVLAVVSLTVYALLRRFRPARESLEVPERQKARHETDEELLVPSVITRFMFPVIAMVAAYLLLRGHNQPGGGFAAGVALAIAVILQYIAGGTRWAEDRLRLRPMRWIGAGLLGAAATGAGAWLFGHPFLTSHTAHFTLPLLGELHVPSAFFFDIGVFSLVVGATGLMLIALAHQSQRHPWN